MVEIAPATAEDVRYVVANWREADRLEILATSETDDPAEWGYGASRGVECGYWRVARIDGVPASIWGAVKSHPGVWHVLGFGTEEWGRVLLPMTRHIKDLMIPTLRDDMGAHLVMCWADIRNVKACKWLEILGAASVCELPLGKGKEMFRLYRWEAL